MVAPDSPSSSNIIHQFLISNPIQSQTHYESQPFDSYGVDLRGLNTYPPQSLNVLPSIQSLGERMSRSIDLIQDPHDQSQLNQPHHNQKLCLSLGSDFLFSSSPQYNRATERCYLVSEEQEQEQEEEEKTRKPCNPSQLCSSFPSLNQSFYGTESLSIVVGSSRYLKPTQSLLEEIVSVGGKEIDSSNELYVRKFSRRLSSELKSEFSSNGFSMEKQHLQSTLTKLISLLEEVETRHEQYYQQLEEVVSSFEAMAGLGSGKSYTSLALNAMSAHFSSLRDVILSQIYAIKKKMSQDFPKINSGFSQMSLFDKDNVRQSRIALQQIGMIAGSRQTWRPIRGLPEASVMILRSWLFEHFLHPYPNDNEKLMLASQTGLSKNQVSNWFINARVRLWKPMIEEMYKEEFADISEDSNL